MTQTTNEPRTVEQLAERVHHMIAGYVHRKTEAKSGIKWEEFRDKKTTDPVTGKARVAVPDRYREAREKVCSDAFLGLRARRSREDFVEYFTGTICSVGHYLPTEDYQALAAALLGPEDEWEDIRSLSMLALSALSNV